ncbi:hypothetical protein [Arthrobacter sp. MA-N2]|uniref:hypothetical protein n=1 Tax=Arthrobacter sp. MA-N2 TaxID=1101188 RepID=UPI0004B804D9|nr:hypothetical protein [Arthrobacter sp. MA-N2]
MAWYLGRRGISMFRPALLAVLGALGWLLWLAGPSQATDILPTIPVPMPSVSLAPIPLPAPIVEQVRSAIPSPSQLAAVPETVVKQVPAQPLSPVVGLVPATLSVVDNTIRELPALPELPAVPALPPVPGVPLPPGPSVPTVPASLRPGSGAALTAFALESPLSPALPELPAAPGASTRILRFIPDELVLTPMAELAIEATSTSSGEPPPDGPLPTTAFQRGWDSTSESQGGSAHGAADLPEQRALAPPLSDGCVPDGDQGPAAGPAFDPGSSPD